VVSVRIFEIRDPMGWREASRSVSKDDSSCFESTRGGVDVFHRETDLAGARKPPPHLRSRFTEAQSHLPPIQKGDAGKLSLEVQAQFAAIESERT